MGIIQIGLSGVALAPAMRMSMLSAREDGRSKLVARAARVFDLVTHPVRHRAVEEALSRPVLRPLRQRQPKLALKYLHPFHLAIGLSSEQRAAVMIRHYDFLATSIPAVALAAINGAGLCLWAHDSDAGRHHIDLVFSDPTDNEGELTLEYRLDETLLSECAFTFAPASVIESRDATILAVTRLQGVRGAFGRTREAMQSVRGMSPAMVFIAALQGIADRFDLSTVAGVAADAQVARVAATGPVVSAYDDFFTGIGGTRANSMFYRIALPLRQKPLSEVKSGNRARTRYQRDMKDAIAKASRAAFSE